MDTAKKMLVKLGTDGQFDLRTKNDKKASSGGRVRPACCEALYCFQCRKKEKESISEEWCSDSSERERAREKERERERGLAQRQRQQQRCPE